MKYFPTGGGGTRLVGWLVGGGIVRRCRETRMIDGSVHVVLKPLVGVCLAERGHRRERRRQRRSSRVTTSRVAAPAGTRAASAAAAAPPTFARRVAVARAARRTQPVSQLVTFLLFTFYFLLFFL